jgi:hypothetical protein
MGLVIAGAPVVAMAGAVQQTLSAAGSVNLCNGDNVNITGNIHLQENEVVSSDGATHFSVSENLQNIQGVDTTTGAVYHVTGGENATENLPVSSANVVTVVERLNFIGKGSAPNFVASFHEHMTLNANGVATVTYQYLTYC